MFLLTRIRLFLTAGLVVAVGVLGYVAFKKIDQRGYARAAAHYERIIEQARVANLDAIKSARVELEVRTQQLNAELISTDAKLKEILDDQAEEYDAGCGAPLRALRLLDEIR